MTDKMVSYVQNVEVLATVYEEASTHLICAYFKLDIFSVKLVLSC